MGSTESMSAWIGKANTDMHVAIGHRVDGAELTEESAARLRSIISKCQQILEGVPESNIAAAARAYEEAHDHVLR